MKKNPKARCAFCNRPRDKVGRLISGQHGLYICNECVVICADTLVEKGLTVRPVPEPQRRIMYGCESAVFRFDVVP